VTSERMAAWVMGLSLIGATLAIHSVGLVGIGLLLIRVGERAVRAMTRLRGIACATSVMIGAAGAAIAALHAIEAGLWAILYHWSGALTTWPDAMLYSVDSISTRGGAGLEPEEGWRMLGALEASDGMLLFGMSTAFLFGVLARIWTLLIVATSPAQDGRSDDARRHDGG
jgi:hypothetical protein